MKKTIIANTFTPIYDEVEDRLRLVINYQDIHNRADLMITRSFILNLIPAAEEFTAKYYVHEKSNDIIQSVNYSTPSEESNTLSKTDGVNLELLRTNEELLLEVNFSFDANTKQTLVIFNSKHIIAKASLDASLMEQTFNIIKSSIPYIKWGISHHF